MDYPIRKAHSEDVGSIFAIMKNAAAETQNSGLFLSDDIDYITDHIEKNGMTFVAEADNTLAAFLAIDIPGNSPHNLGLDIGLPLCELSKVALMDSIVVSSEFRGNSLQKALLEYAQAQAAAMGYIHFMATVHPDNAPSLKSFLSLGYVIKVTKPKYGGLLRHILYKNADSHK